MNINAKEFANNWIESWNSHDLDRILAHYSDDFEIVTPMIKVALGIETGMLKGKNAIRNYWEAAFKKVPDLCFELKEVAFGIESIAVCYKSVFEKTAVEVMFFNEQGKINKVIVHYT